MMLCKLRFIQVTFFLIFLSACSSRDDYMNRGTEYFQQGQYDLAAIEFKNILQEQENNTDALYWLALTYEKRDNWENAYRHYSKIVQLNPVHVKARIKLAEIYAAYEMPEEMARSIESIEKIDPENDAIKLLKAKALLLNGDLTKARIQAESVYDNEEVKTPETILFLARLYAQQGNLDKGISLLKEGVRDNSHDIRLLISLARMQIEQGNNQHLIKLLEKIKQSPARNPTNSVTLAQIYASLDMLDEAEGVLRDSVSRFDDLYSKSALIEFLTELRSHALALKEARVLVEQSPDEHELRIMLAELHEMIDENDKAIQEYEYVIDYAGNSKYGLKAQSKIAQLLIQKKEVKKAKEMLDAIISKDPDNDQARLLRGQLYLNGGHHVLALAEVSKVLKNNPESFPALSLLANIHIRNDNIPLALHTLRKAIAANPEDTNVRLKLAKLMESRGDTDSAISVLEEALEQTRGHPSLLKSLHELQIKIQDWEGAIKSAARYKKAHPRTTAGYLLAGSLCQRMGDIESARREFELALQLKPAAREPLTAIVNDYIAEDMGFLAAERVKEVIEAYPDAFFAYHLLGKSAWSEGLYKAAETAFRKAIDLQSKWSAPYISLGDMLIQRGSTRKAFSVYQDGIKNSTDPLAVQFKVGMAYEKLGQFDLAIDNYEQILHQNPEAHNAINNLALLLVTQKNDDNSRKRALEIVQPFYQTGTLVFKDTLGWVLYKNNNIDAAISVLTDVVERAPQIAEFQYHLGMAFSKKGYKTLARRHLTNALNNDTDFQGIQEARKTLASL